MISDLLKIILVEIVLIYIGIRILYRYYKKEQDDKDRRLLEFEKRLGTLENSKSKKK